MQTFLLVLTKLSYCALGYHSTQFRYFPKILSLKSFRNWWGNSYIPWLQVIIAQHFTCRKWKILVKHQKASKYYETDCLQNFLLLCLFLLIAKLGKNIHIYAMFIRILLLNVLKQTWNFFNTKFQSQWKDQKIIYLVRSVVGLFYHLTALILGYKNLKGLTYNSKYLRLTFVFSWNRAQREKFNF